MSGSLAVAFLPWLVFAVAVRNGGMGFTWAAFAGLATALAVVLVARRRGGIGRSFEAATFGLFVVLCAAGLALRPHWAEIDDYARALAAGCVAALAFGSLLRHPVTEQYTRDAVRARDLHGAEFLRVNRRLTAVWGTGALCMAASYALGAVFDGALPATIFNWFVPLALVLGCVRCCTTQWRAALPDDESEEQALLASVAGTPGPVFGPFVPAEERRRHLRPIGGGKGR